jgi:O-antigen biosynthesis protein
VNGRPRQEGDLPLVSVIVPVLDGEAVIGDCLAALLAMDYPSDRREIVVVDNGSIDRTAEVVGRHPVRYVHESERGPARARNAGIVASDGEVVAFTDSDCLATSGWLREIVAALDEDGVGGVAGEILPYPPRTAAERYAARLRHLSPQRYLARPIMPFAVTANLAFPRAVMDRVGRFDPHAPRGGESTDYCTRFFRATGLELRFAPRAAVFHRHRDSAWELVRQQWGYGRGHAYLYRKYGDEIPWGWRQRIGVYADLARAAGSLGLSGAARLAGRSNGDALEFAYFELLRKLALRAGFVRQSLVGGRSRP